MASIRTTRGRENAFTDTADVGQINEEKAATTRTSNPGASHPRQAQFPPLAANASTSRAVMLQTRDSIACTNWEWKKRLELVKCRGNAPRCAAALSDSNQT